MYRAYNACLGPESRFLIHVREEKGLHFILALAIAARTKVIMAKHPLAGSSLPERSLFT